MKNRLLFEKIVQSIAPAVTQYHMELQLKNKKRDESEFTLHRETPRFIAEDCTDIAMAIVNELEQTRNQSKKATVAKIMEAISTKEDQKNDAPAIAIAAGTKPKS
jgi:hypothetical protein